MASRIPRRQRRSVIRRIIWWHPISASVALFQKPMRQRGNSTQADQDQRNGPGNHTRLPCIISKPMTMFVDNADSGPGEAEKPHDGGHEAERQP